MGKPFIKFHNISFTYETAAEPLFRDLVLHLAPGWCGVVGANGAGKTTLLKLAAGLLLPTSGHIDKPADAIYCAQHTDVMPDQLKQLIFTNDKTARIVKNRLGIEDDWCDRWQTLSHGERKRAQIAAALWLEPDVLAIDEPTNHLDSEGREIIAEALHSFKGVGLLVSHDRELLDSLCSQCLFLDPPEVIARPGGITQAMAAIKEEQRYIKKQHDLKKSTIKKLKRETSRRRDLAKQSHKRLSKRGLAAKDHDARAKRDLARLTGKDGVGGKLQRQMQSRLDQVRDDFKDIKVKKEYNTGIWLPGSLSTRNFLLRLKEGAVPLGGEKKLNFPELLIKPADRFAVTGPNGSGKSTLIRHIVDSLNVPPEHITYVPQEISLADARELLARVLALPEDELGHLMIIISRLGSRPYRLLDSAEPSPGETRKLLLALGMTCRPHIIIMDEPTNHMDLPSIECLEQALSDCPCALLLVSHDRVFLDKLTQKRWHITQSSHSQLNYNLEIKQ